MMPICLYVGIIVPSGGSLFLFRVKTGLHIPISVLRSLKIPTSLYVRDNVDFGERVDEGTLTVLKADNYCEVEVDCE